MDMMLWNAILSLVTGLMLLVLKNAWDEVTRLQVLLNKTREELAKEYVTKADVHSDINRVIQRIDRLEEKLDKFMERQ